MWAPYSSTGNLFNFKLIVFACATLDKVFIFDLNVDKIGKLAE